MLNKDIFNALVNDPKNFEIQGLEEPKSPKANQDLQERLEKFIERLEDFTGDYAHHSYYDIEPGDEIDAEEEIAARNLAQYDQQLLTYRLEFVDLIHDGARLLNCDTRDIFESMDVEESEVYRSFSRLRDSQDFTDQDALRVLSGLHNESIATLQELSSGKRSLETALSRYMADNEDGMMYDDPDAIEPDSPTNP